MNVLGIIGFGQNPAACLLMDGKLVAFAEEERFTRIKSSDGVFPSKSVRYCLDFARLPLTGVDRIAFGWDATKYPWRMVQNFGMNFLKYRGRAGKAFYQKKESSSIFTAAETLLEFHPGMLRSKIQASLRAIGFAGDVPRVEFVPHHLAHAYSTYFCSKFTRAGVLTIDGSGEEMCTQLAVGHGDELRVVESLPIPDSLGWFYAAITQYVGMLPYRDEGKLMGLAAYGEERRHENKWMDPLSKVLQIKDGGYSVDPIYTKFGGHYYGDRFTDELVQLLCKTDKRAVPITYGEKASINGRMQSKYLDPTYIDLAWAAQELLEQAAVTMARTLVRSYGTENLCIAGGVGLNCKMNGEILRRSGCKNIFVQPASNDAGTALGAAMFVAKSLGDRVRNPLDHVYYGPGFSNDEIRRDLDGLKIRYTQSGDVSEKAANYLAQGKLVGWFQNRMEFGARALGDRSILANPTIAAAKDKVNTQVKYRENWRPFCPSILDECKNDYLESPNEASFMIVAYQVKPEASKDLAAVVHVDGTVRPQAVKREINPQFHALIAALGKQTGHPVVLNTSLNVRSEPIICTPLEAVRCFYSNGLDVLVLGDFILEKERGS